MMSAIIQREIETNKRNKRGSSAVAKATAQTGTKEMSKRSKEELNSGFSAESLDFGDQSPLQSVASTKTIKNRRGRPGKDEARVKDKTLSIGQVIREARTELRGYLVKTKEIVLRVGQAFENAGIKPSTICRKIKEAFAEEIAEDLIHPRTIENYCPDEWKIKTKPPKKGQKNEKRSFSESEGTLPTESVEEATSQTTPRKHTTMQTMFMITEEKYAAVRQTIDQAIDLGKKRCYGWINQNNELDSIEVNEPRVVEATIGE